MQIVNSLKWKKKKTYLEDPFHYVDGLNKSCILYLGNLVFTNVH